MPFNHWCIVHDAFKLGYHNILQHLDTPPLDDLPNFIGYCTAWAQNIVDHHDTEGASPSSTSKILRGQLMTCHGIPTEALLFPFLSKHLNMDGEIEQHKVMHAALDEFIAFLHDPRNVQPDTFDADAMRMKLVALKDPLVRPPIPASLPPTHTDTVHASRRGSIAHRARERASVRPRRGRGFMCTTRQVRAGARKPVDGGAVHAQVRPHLASPIFTT